MHHAYHQATSKNPWPAVNQVICDAALGVQTNNPATDGLIPPGDGADRPGPCKGPTQRVFRTSLGLSASWVDYQADGKEKKTETRDPRAAFNAFWSPVSG
jgi:hypothetical protein